jgi:hypothetical protein
MDLETINRDRRLQEEASQENTSGDRLEEIANSSVELARLVANNLATPYKLLRQLSDSQDFLTRRNVARNPNIPSNLLIKLGKEFPEDFFGNPILNLLILESPNFFDQIPLETLIPLSQYESAPDYFLRAVENLMLTFCSDSMDLRYQGNVNHKYIVELFLILIKNPRTSHDFIKKMISSRDSFIVENVQLHIVISGEIKHGWKEKAQKIIPETQIIKDKYFATLKELERIKFISDSPFLKILHLQPITDHIKEYRSSKLDDTLANLSIFYQYVLTEYLADKEKKQNNIYSRTDERNSDILGKVLQERDRSKNQQEKSAIAPQTPGEILAKLAQVKDPEVREKVARNPQTPVKILEKLAKDENEWVRRSITENPNAPSHILEELSKNADFWMCHALVVNPNTPSSTLAYLASFNDWELNQKILVHPHTELSLLVKILKNEESLCVRLLTKENIPDIILVELLSHPSEEVLKFSVGRYLAQHPDLVSLVIEKYPNYQIPSFSRLIILFHPETPNSFLRHAIASLYWIERFAVAQNPNTSRELLQILAQDLNQLVRAAATDNLQKKST